MKTTPQAITSKVIKSLRSGKQVAGLTHSSYSYPARFSPELAQEIIANFSEPGDCVFDSFMGGGTTVVQSLAMGRKALGVDINSLSYFVSLCKTTPISKQNAMNLKYWIDNIQIDWKNNLPSFEISEFQRHFPKRFLRQIDSILVSTKYLKDAKTKRVARFLVLRVYQGFLIRGKMDHAPSAIKRRMSFELNKILVGLDQFSSACMNNGINKAEVISNRRLLNRSVIGIENDNRINHLQNVPKLVFTSPPYPGVHVLYNKWQIASRKETSLPYYISGTQDSKPEAYYTMGGRSRNGLENYFNLIKQSFLSISKIIDKQAWVVQLLGFSDVNSQLPLYLSAMKEAGFTETFPLSTKGTRIWRDVPNRKWYTNGRQQWDASKEVLLFHRL